MLEGVFAFCEDRFCVKRGDVADTILGAVKSDALIESYIEKLFCVHP